MLRKNYLRYERILSKGQQKGFDKFKELAFEVVDKMCNNVDHTPILGDDRDILAGDFAIDMFAGSELTKNKYLLIGGITGVFLTCGTIIVYKIIKEKKKES